MEIALTQAELQEQVLERVTAKILDEFFDSDALHMQMEDRVATVVREQIDTKVEQIAAEVVEPRITEAIEGVTLQKTNEWGDKKGEALTFREYLVERTEAWVLEPVDFRGKTRAEDSYNWKNAQTRVAWLIDQNIQFHIKRAVETALKDVNSRVAQGIADTVKAQLADVLGKLKVEVKK